MRVDFDGIISGDGDCFTFAVDEETFTRIAGHPPDMWDKSHYHKGLFDLTPSDVFNEDALNPNKDKQKFTVLIGE